MSIHGEDLEQEKDYTKFRSELFFFLAYCLLIFRN